MIFTTEQDTFLKRKGANCTSDKLKPRSGLCVRRQFLKGLWHKMNFNFLPFNEVESKNYLDVCWDPLWDYLAECA